MQAVGLAWHTPGRPYWNESAFYEFTAREVDILEAATNELEAMSLAAVQPLIEHSWEAEQPSLYGRFDLAWGGEASPKLLEYNADTPTSLVEAAVAQWYWLEDTHPGADQFNSIHERLIAAWEGTGAVAARWTH